MTRAQLQAYSAWVRSGWRAEELGMSDAGVFVHVALWAEEHPDE